MALVPRILPIPPFRASFFRPARRRKIFLRPLDQKLSTFGGLPSDINREFSAISASWDSFLNSVPSPAGTVFSSPDSPPSRSSRMPPEFSEFVTGFFPSFSNRLSIILAFEFEADLFLRRKQLLFQIQPMYE